MNKPIFYALLGLAATASSESASADSLRIQWPDNGHFYQRFDRPGTIWSDGKNGCEAKGAHLATITSQEEQGFVANRFTDDQQSGAEWHIGGSDAANPGQWQWITGEAWAYENWDFGQPENNREGDDYLIIRARSNEWADVPADFTASGYICEWSTHTYIGTAGVPDMNDNGADEVAVLFVNFRNGAHTVWIRDSFSRKIVRKLVFLKQFEPLPKGIASVNDFNGNGFSELGVLYDDRDRPTVMLRDAKTRKVLKKVRFLNIHFRSASVSTLPDMNGNGADELLVVGVHRESGKARAEIRDSKTGNRLERPIPF